MIFSMASFKCPKKSRIPFALRMHLIYDYLEALFSSPAHLNETYHLLEHLLRREPCEGCYMPGTTAFP